MNGNNDGGRHRITGRDGAGHPVRSAFFRRDDVGREDTEITAEAYLRSLADQEQENVVAESRDQRAEEPVEMAAVVDESTATNEGEATITVEAELEQMDTQVMMNNEEQQQAQVATSAHTRDAARLRSIMRGGDAGATARTAPSHELTSKSVATAPAPAVAAPVRDGIDQTDEEKTIDLAAVIPLPTESTPSFTSAPMPVVEKPILPLEIDIIRPIAHVADLDVIADDESVVEPAIDVVVEAAIPEETITVEMQSVEAAELAPVDGTIELTTADGPNEEERAHDIVTIVRYPQEECELVVPDADAIHDAYHVDPEVAALAQADTATVSAVANTEAATFVASDVEENAASSDESDLDTTVVAELPVDPVADDARRDDDQAGTVESVTLQVTPSPALPSRTPVKEEAVRKATRLRPPEPRATEVRLPRSVQIAPSNTAPQPAPAKRERRGLVAETRLRAVGTEASASRPIMNTTVQQTVARPVSEPAARPAERPVVQQVPRYEEPAPRVEPSYSRHFEAISPMEISKKEIEQQPQTEETVDPFAAEFQKKKKLVIAVSTVTVGVILGLGLYAGGADYVSGLFANKHEGINSSRAAAVTAPTLADRPSATERAIDPAAPSESLVSSPAKSHAPKPAADDATSDNVPPAKKAEPAVTHQKSTATEKGASESKHTAAASQKSTSRERSGAEKPTGSTKLAAGTKAVPQQKGAKVAAKTAKADQHLVAHNADAAKKADVKSAAQRNGKDAFTVQVRATKDASEAKKIAAKLKAKGVRGVTIVTSDNGGNKLYRVRFGSYGTTADAKTAAGRAGVDGAWVVKQH